MKTFGSVLLGYITLFVLVFVSYTCLYSVLGEEGAFMPKSYAVSTPWLTVSLGLSFLAALIAGILTNKIGGDDASIWLIVVIVLLGIALSVMNLGAPPAGERGASVPPMEAMAKAVTPNWAQFVNAILSAVGAAVGWKLAKPKG
jgi:hypothetical protein